MKTLKILRKRGFALFLALVMCLGLSVTAYAEEKSSVSLSWGLSAEKLQASNEDQYVTFKLTAAPKAVAPLVNNLGHIFFTVSVADELEVVSVESSQITYTRNGNTFECFRMNNEDGHGYNYSVTDVGTITVKVPAGTSAGAYSIGVTNVRYTLWNDSGSYYGNFSWPSVGTTLTIEGEPEPTTTPVASVTLDQASLALTEGESATLAATVLPEDATDATVTWTSSDENVATVANGVVTAIAAGNATITAAAGDVSATCAVTVSAKEEPKPDPVVPESYTIDIARNGEGDVYVGDTVTMDVTVSGADFDGYYAIVTYEPSVFSYAGDAEKTGRIMIENHNGAYTAGQTVESLQFTAEAVGTGTFDFFYGTVNTYAAAKNGNAVPATLGSAKVEVVEKQYKVSFVVDGETVAEEQVVSGQTVKSVPGATKEYHVFNGWKMNDGADLMTSEVVAAQAIDADTIFTAQFSAAEYDVDLAEGLSGAERATYGEAYVVTIDDYDTSNEYTITYKITDSVTDETKTESVTATGKTVTIPAGDITGEMKVTVTSAPVFEVEVHNGYLNGGYTLVLVKGSAANGYTYAGQNTYYAEKYEAYATLVYSETELTVDAAKANVGIAATKCETIENTENDVNHSGNADYNDVLVAYACYNLADGYSVADDMVLFLSADVNVDYVVDTHDVSAILSALQ